MEGATGDRLGRNAGVVSLAAALSIPLITGEGRPFPYRNLILFITFIVILVTLVLQGLTLPWLIRKLKLEDRNTMIPEEKQKIIIQKKISQSSLRYLEKKYPEDWSKDEQLHNLHKRLSSDLKVFNEQLENIGNTKENPIKNFQQVYLELLDQQRQMLNRINRHNEFDEDLIRKYLLLVDLEELKIRGK